MEDFRTKFAKANLQKAKNKKLSPWEKEFIQSMDEKLNKNISLSKKEYNNLEMLAQR